VPIETGTEVFAEFTLTGENFDPDEVTRRLGLEPTKSWKAGDLQVPGATIRHKVAGWRLRTPREKSFDVGPHVAALVESLKPLIPRINAVQQALQLEAEFSCVVYIKDQSPAVYFERAVLDVVEALKAEIDIDIYVLPTSE
jgi:hypothetical protein